MVLETGQRRKHSPDTFECQKSSTQVSPAICTSRDTMVMVLETKLGNIVITLLVYRYVIAWEEHGKREVHTGTYRRKHSYK
jgi:hypothetical protein